MRMLVIFIIFNPLGLVRRLKPMNTGSLKLATAMLKNAEKIPNPTVS